MSAAGEASGLSERLGPAIDVKIEPPTLREVLRAKVRDLRHRLARPGLQWRSEPVRVRAKTR